MRLNRRGTFVLIKSAGIASALGVALLCGAIFIAATGSDPVNVYWKMLSETIGTTYGIGQVLFKATTFIFTGLSAAICFRAGLFNIGGEGQLIAGAFCISIIGSTFTGLPPFLIISLCVIGGIAGGAFWAFVPGLLKARFGSHEVINTIMMNYIAAALVSFLVNSVFAVPATVHTPAISQAAQLPRFDTFGRYFQGSPVNVSFGIALLSCAAVWYFFGQSQCSKRRGLWRVRCPSRTRLFYCPNDSRARKAVCCRDAQRLLT